MTIRIAVTDDRPIFLTGLEVVLRREKDFEILACCANGEETIVALRRLRPDVLLLELHRSGGRGFDVIRQIRKEKLPVRVVLLSALLDDHELIEAVTLGVCGNFFEGAASHRLIQCIRKVHSGQLWFEREENAKAVEKLLWQQAATREKNSLLSRRELEIATLVGFGMANKEIAKRKFISEGTVKSHLHNIYGNLNIKNRFALALYVRENGLIQEMLR